MCQKLMYLNLMHISKYELSYCLSNNYKYNIDLISKYYGPDNNYLSMCCLRNYRHYHVATSYRDMVIDKCFICHVKHSRCPLIKLVVWSMH